MAAIDIVVVIVIVIFVTKIVLISAIIIGIFVVVVALQCVADAAARNELLRRNGFDIRVVAALR